MHASRTVLKFDGTKILLLLLRIPAILCSRQKSQKFVSPGFAGLKFWDHCRRRFQTWTWLESMATGLGRDPFTGRILASPEWWVQMEGVSRCTTCF